jgi:hypothetical protein
LIVTKKIIDDPINLFNQRNSIEKNEEKKRMIFILYFSTVFPLIKKNALNPSSNTTVLCITQNKEITHLYQNNKN